MGVARGALRSASTLLTHAFPWMLLLAVLGRVSIFGAMDLHLQQPPTGAALMPLLLAHVKTIVLGLAIGIAGGLVVGTAVGLAYGLTIATRRRDCWRPRSWDRCWARLRAHDRTRRRARCRAHLWDHYRARLWDRWRPHLWDRWRARWRARFRVRWWARFRHRWRAHFWGRCHARFSGLITGSPVGSPSESRQRGLSIFRPTFCSYGRGRMPRGIATIRWHGMTFVALLSLVYRACSRPTGDPRLFGWRQ